jgi:predicted phosphodiesterase
VICTAKHITHDKTVTENELVKTHTLAVAIVSIIVIVSATTVFLLQSCFLFNSNDTLNFYVCGDSQGYQGGLEQIVTIANEYRPNFVFHCGDLTPFGQENQYTDVLTTLDGLNVPFHTTPGNHDTRLGGGARYIEHFGFPNYSFDLGPAHFTAFNTSAGDISEEDFTWLENDLMESNADWKFVFTHIPPFDPRPTENHTLLNLSTSTRLLSLFENTGVDTVFVGHIHMYNQTMRNGVRYVISGGAGASLVAEPNQGGIHHFVNVTLSKSNLIIESIELDSPILQRDSILIVGTNEHITLSIDDLLLLENIEEYSSFQNQYGNWGGQGTYKGVKIATLIELVEGMNTTSTIRVVASDGFEQNFCYWNVYPNASWYEAQGDMILAYSYNNTRVPDWGDGLRLVMLPQDSDYSNNDCIATSALGMGCYLYASAGARWVRWVNLIEVIPR